MFILKKITWSNKKSRQLLFFFSTRIPSFVNFYIIIFLKIIIFLMKHTRNLLMKIIMLIKSFLKHCMGRKNSVKGKIKMDFVLLVNKFCFGALVIPSLYIVIVNNFSALQIISRGYVLPKIFPKSTNFHI